MARESRPPMGYQALIGLDMCERGEGYSKARISIGPDHMNPHGVAHGAVLYALADTGMGLALYPTLDNPELEKAIDNLPYRAKRILLSWTAWLLGGGQPFWIVHLYPLLNVACWLILAWLLWRWFPPR
mgnify:CR=1 FL=1